jgi:hypothetical protein
MMPTSIIARMRIEPPRRASGGKARLGIEPTASPSSGRSCRPVARARRCEGYQQTQRWLSADSFADVAGDLWAMRRMAAERPGPIATPDFVRALSTTYVDARGKREDADHNLGEPFDEADARQLHNRVANAIRGWQAANTQADRDTKHAVALLLSLKGKLRD